MKLQDPRCLVVLLLLAAAVWPASAGEPALDLLPASLRERLQQTQASLPIDGWARLQSLPPGTMLRVALKRARVLRGKLVSITDEALTLRISRRKLRTEPRAQVVRVHRRHHDPLSNGVLNGLGVGAAGGAVVGASLDPASTDYARSGAVLFLGLFGAGVGTAIGPSRIGPGLSLRSSMKSQCKNRHNTILRGHNHEVHLCGDWLALSRQCFFPCRGSSAGGREGSGVAGRGRGRWG